MELPEHINATNAGQIREELLSVINRGATALIADMTVTISCDQAGADAILGAHRRAVISDSELRLVVTAQIVRRVISISGLDRLVCVYPSVAAAAAAGPPAAVVMLAARSASGGKHGPVRDGRLGAEPADVTPAAVWQLLDALHDAVALTEADGTIVFANARLADLFCYQAAGLRGRSIDSLVSAELQAQKQGQRAQVAARSAGIGTQLAGLRYDGTTFPAEISFSPIPAGAARLTLAIVRDLTVTPEVPRLMPLALPAITAGQRQADRELLDRVVTRLFRVGLSLQATADLPAQEARQRVAEVLDYLDDTVRQIRDAAFPVPSRDAR